MSNDNILIRILAKSRIYDDFLKMYGILTVEAFEDIEMIARIGYSK